ncbi:hypothetical protein IRJ41_015044 [Triplophysa rosa]|uniref:Uncharacterized protein n=1 Tax=Triplophysa rosa TaxID=992332 RepID=A0A9W7WBV6_TRIRA|nr:hypothetical protein IRJ41_015044 [Triplophysa rosa]
MTTVNAPCSLLARNEFYRSINPTDPIKAVNNFSDTLIEPKQRQVTVWVTISKHQDYSGHMTNAWTLGLILRSPASSSRTSGRCLSPADRVVK